MNDLFQEPENTEGTAIQESEITSGLPIEPDVLNNKNNFEKEATLPDKYNVTLFETKYQQKDYQAYEKTVFTKDTKILDKNQQSFLFNQTIIYNEKPEESFTKQISNILMIIVLLEILYLFYKLWSKRRKKRKMKRSENVENNNKVQK